MKFIDILQESGVQFRPRSLFDHVMLQPVARYFVNTGTWDLIALNKQQQIQFHARTNDVDITSLYALKSKSSNYTIYVGKTWDDDTYVGHGTNPVKVSEKQIFTNHSRYKQYIIDLSQKI